MFWKEQKNANTLGVLIRQSGSFTSYNFAQFVQEGFQVVHELDTCCNNQVNLMTFTLAKEVLNGKI